MDMIKATTQAKTKIEQLTGLTSASVIGLTKEEDHWVVTLELIEKKSIPDAMDVLGTYEVRINQDGEVRDFVRTRLRKRGDTSNEV